MSDFDLVKRLRAGAGRGIIPLCQEAADRIEALAARVAKLEEALKECADDLSEWVENYYEKTKDYPSELRRYERDIEPVIKARAALDHTQSPPPAIGEGE